MPAVSEPFPDDPTKGPPPPGSDGAQPVPGGHGAPAGGGTMTVLPEADVPPGEPPSPAPTPRTPTAVPPRIGRFEVRRYLGEGAFGRVYEAFDPTLRRVVA